MLYNMGFFSFLKNAGSSISDAFHKTLSGINSIGSKVVHAVESPLGQTISAGLAGSGIPILSELGGVGLLAPTVGEKILSATKGLESSLYGQPPSLQATTPTPVGRPLPAVSQTANVRGAVPLPPTTGPINRASSILRPPPPPPPQPPQPQMQTGGFLGAVMNDMNNRQQNQGTRGRTVSFF